MVRRRSFLKLAIASAAYAINPTTKLFSNGDFLKSAHAFVDPVTAVTVASTAVGLLKSFSGSSDGGLSAMLQAQLQTLNLISSQLDSVIATLADVQAKMAKFPDHVIKANELNRLIVYYDEMSSGALTFQKTFEGETGKKRSTKENYKKDYEEIAKYMGRVQGKMRSYTSLIPAISLPLCLGVEIAALRRAERYDLVGPALNQYSKWVEQIIDHEHVGSIASSLKNELSADFDKFTKECGAYFTEGQNICVPKKDAPTATGDLAQGSKMVACLTPLHEQHQIIFSSSGNSPSIQTRSQVVHVPRQVTLRSIVKTAHRNGVALIDVLPMNFDYEPSKYSGCTKFRLDSAALGNVFLGYPDSTLFINDIPPNFEAQFKTEAFRQSGPQEVYAAEMKKITLAAEKVSAHQLIIAAHADAMIIAFESRKRIEALKREFA